MTPNAAMPPQRGQSTTIALIAIGLTALTLAAYWNTFSNEFVRYDDHHYVFENPVVQSGLSRHGVIWSFTTFHTGNWHPITWLSHMLDVQMFGINPSGHHLINVALHIANALVLVFLVNWMTQRMWLSAILAALFALHPLRVESVAWVSERKDLLSALFGLLCIHAYVRYAKRPSLKTYWPVPVWMALSLMAKPMLVTLPLLLLLLDFWPLQRTRLFHGQAPLGREHSTTWRQLIIEKLPLSALSIASCVVTIVAQRSNQNVTPLSILPFDDRLANAAISYVRYLGNTFWPVDLAALYPYPLQWPLWQSVVATMMLIAITVATLIGWKRTPFLVIGWMWYLIALVPVIGLVQVGAQSMADRYTYLPSIGIMILVVWGFDALLRKPALRLIGATMAAIAILSLTVLTSVQSRTWRDTGTLFLHAVQVTENNVIAMDLLARALAEDNPDIDPVLKLKQISQTSGIAANVYFNLAESFLKRGDLNTAISLYEETLALHRNHVGANNNLAWLLATHPEGSRRDGARAVALALRAAELTNVSDAGILDTLAVAHAEMNEFHAAIENATKAREIASNRSQHELVTIIDHHLAMFQTSRPIRIAQ